MTKLGFELGGLAVEYRFLTTVLHSLNFNIYMIYISMSVSMISNLQAIFPKQKGSFLSTASYTVSGLKAMN